MNESGITETTAPIEINVAATGGSPNSIPPSTDELFEKYSIPNEPARGPGRHKDNCACAKCVQKRAKLGFSPGGPASAAVGDQSNNPPLDTAFISESIQTIAKVIDGLLTGRVETLAIIVTNDKNYAAKLVDGLELKETERKLIGDLGAKLCEKYQVLGQYSLEAVLAVSILGYAGRYGMAFADLKRMARQRAEAIASQPRK